MERYSVTRKAREDLILIWNYTFDYWSERQADLYYGSIVESFDKICDNPNLGRNYEDIENDLFGLLVGMHIVFFRKLGENKIEITRILHSRMDLKNRIKE
jgi:toxin ParE1/3/4